MYRCSLSIGGVLALNVFTVLNQFLNIGLSALSVVLSIDLFGISLGSVLLSFIVLFVFMSFVIHAIRGSD